MGKVEMVSKRSSNPKETVSSPTANEHDVAKGSIFHAVETAEKAVFHGLKRVEHVFEDAVRDEVGTMFHEMKKPAFTNRKEKSMDMNPHLTFIMAGGWE